jgi:hypothetical protein
MTTDQTTDLASFEDTIASLRAGRTNHPLARITAPATGGAVRLNDGGAVLADGEGDAIAADRAAAGVSLAGVQNDIHALTTRIGYLTEQLGRVSFDPRSGEQVVNLPTGVAEAHRLELAGLTEELAIAQQTRLAVVERRAAEQAREQVHAENDAMAFEFHGGNAERKAALEAALLAKEAEFMAEHLLRRRYGAR